MVSICCITYNHEKYIKDALESFLMQKTEFPIEILIHDDASSDKTADIIREYQNKFSEIIKPIFQKENQVSKGVTSITYKYNYSRAEGKYIALCEGDDYWTDPYKLQKQVDYMESHPECSLCVHAAYIISSNKKILTKHLRPYIKSKYFSIEEIIEENNYKRYGGRFPTNSFLFRIKYMFNMPNFYFKSTNEDFATVLYLSIKGKVYYIDEFMSVYRQGIKGSWNYRKLKNDNINKSNIIKINEMLNDFNVNTNYMYDDIIKKKVKKNETFLLIIDKQYRKIKSKEYYNIYKELDSIMRYYITLGYYFPGLAKMIMKIKRKLTIWRMK